MGPIQPPETLPVAIKIAGGLSPERVIFIDGGVRNDAKWFDISLQCGPSLTEKDDIALRIVVNFQKDYANYTTNSCISGVWDDALARKKELIIKGQVDKAKDIEDSLPDLLRCNLSPPLRLSTIELKPGLIFNPPQTMRTKKVKSMTLEDLNKIRKDLPDNPLGTHSPISPENIKQTLTEAGGPTSTSTARNDSKKVADKQKPAQDGSKPEQNKSQLNMSSKGETETITSSTSFNMLLQNTFQPVASEYFDPDKAVRFRSPDDIKEAENLKHDINLLQKIKLSDERLSELEDFSESELYEIDMHPNKPFSLALECLENGYLLYLNSELFCVYPHHFDYDRVSYIVFNGDIDLELVEVGGGKAPDRTLVVDLYDEVKWSSQVLVLTDDNFNQLVLCSREMWIVNAYTAWCPACQQLHPVLQTAALELMGKIKVGACDCERNEQLHDELDVKFYPMLVCFPEGTKDIKQYKTYHGKYIASQILVWATTMLERGRIKRSLKDKTSPLYEPLRRGYAHNAGPRTLRKDKKSIIERRGYLVSSYGYILRKAEERPEYHETSSTKFIYKSTQTSIDAKSDYDDEGDNACYEISRMKDMKKS